MPAPLEKLFAVRSQLATALLEYLQLVIEAPDRSDTLPAYMSGRTHTTLFIEPDVLKREFRTV